MKEHKNAINSDVKKLRFLPPVMAGVRRYAMRNVFEMLSTMFAKKDNTMEQRLEKILSIAGDIAKQNPDALRDFVRLLGRKLQSDYMCRAVSWLDEHEVPTLEPKLVWFDEFSPLNSDGHRVYDLKKKTGATRTLNLASDIILPWPWNLSRVASNISSIGSGRPRGRWKQDAVNHKVEYWLPFGIGWVHGGNHSIMTGIVQGEGRLTTDCVYDLSPLFPHVCFDGKAFIRLNDGSVLQEATEFEFAAIFEVGRIMHEHRISA